MKFYLIHIADWVDHVILKHRYIGFCEWVAFSAAWPAFCNCWYCGGIREENEEHDGPSTPR